MIRATHIIGRTAREQGAIRQCSDSARRAAALASVQARYATIAAGGWLLARAHQPAWSIHPVEKTGRSFDFDDLAGDDRFVFLDSGTRYLNGDADACYGWQFDAEQLVSACGALVGDGDLADEYGDVIWLACEEIAATLPRLEPVSEAELAAFATLMGEDDSALLDYVRQASMDPADALYDAVRGMPAAIELPASAITAAQTLARQRLHAIQRWRRRAGRAALTLLRRGGHCEILVPDRLDLRLAIARVEAGTIHG